MKKERPARLTLARETLLQLTDEMLRDLCGGSNPTGSAVHCPGDKPESHLQTC